MLSIYETIYRTIEKNFKNKPPEFKEGAETVLTLFEIAIKKANWFNNAITVRELRKQNLKQKSTIDQLQKEIANKADKIFELSLVSGQPSEHFQLYDIPVLDTTFEIVTNMDLETFKVCLFNFEQKHSFKRADEAKSKLLTFINSKRHIGYYAYKSLKVYKKDHPKTKLR